MLRWRLLSAGIILTVLLSLLYIDFNFAIDAPGLWLVPAALVISAMAAGEVFVMLRRGGWDPVGWVVVGGTLVVMASSCAPMAWQLIQRPYPAQCPLGQLGWPLAAFIAVVPVALVAEMRRYHQPGRAIVNAALALFVVAYIGLSMSFLTALRVFHDSDWGMAALVSMIVIVKTSDTGAYFTGRKFGKKRLAPILSPGKSVEGLVGGLATGCLCAWLFRWLILPVMVGPESETLAGPWWGWLLYGLIVGIAGVIGDLAESLLKRDMDCKDSSSWLPGLGGVMDILDSILSGAAAAYFCWLLGLIGPG